MYKTLQDDNDARTNIDPNSFCRKLFNVKKFLTNRRNIKGQEKKT